VKTILSITLKSALRDPFLLFWSILLPVGGTIGLGLFIKQPGYPSQIMTGMMASGIFFYAFTTAVFTVFSQRRRGVYNLLRVTPMPLWKYICAISGAWVLISLFCMLLVLAAGTLMFGIMLSILPMLMLLPIAFVAALGYVLLSFFISGFCRTDSQASILTNIVSMPLLFCSSGFYAVDSAPAWFRTITRFNPFQWFVDGLRSALTFNAQGWLISLALLLAVAVLALLLAVRTFQFADA
jgi:ABC-2 type transport system permease protein